MAELSFGNPKEKVFLDFLPCKSTGTPVKYDDWHPKDYLRVYVSVYEKLVPYLKEVFPLPYPNLVYSNSMEPQDFFDVCSPSWIQANDWGRIITHIKKDVPFMKDNDDVLFFNDFILWIEDQMEWANIIVVDGNQ